MRFFNTVGLVAALPLLTSAFTISDVTSKAASTFAKRDTVSDILTDIEDAASKSDFSVVCVHIWECFASSDEKIFLRVSSPAIPCALPNLLRKTNADSKTLKLAPLVKYEAFPTTRSGMRSADPNANR